jgi:hypothetical protein
MRNTFPIAHPNIQPVSEPTVFHDAENNSRGEKSQDFSKKPARKKFSTKSTAPPAAGAKTSIADNRVGVMLEYSDMQNARNRDFPDENTRFTTRECRSTPTRNLNCRGTSEPHVSMPAHKSDTKIAKSSKKNANQDRSQTRAAFDRSAVRRFT